jgi:tRNA(His) 5'-end guanylyltransferase
VSASKSRDEFGDRMKAYEAVEASRALDGFLPIYARIDGRSFSNFTRAMRRPFDERMTAAMVGVTKHLVSSTHARIGYTQSDEISLVWLADAPDSEPLFGGKVQKLTSVLASMAAASMQYEIRQAFDAEDANVLCAALPHFDCRIFSLPSKSEAANAFLWRAMDARKNAVSMATRSVYSSKQMHGQDQAAMRAMLAKKGIDFETYPASFKWGTWVRRSNYERSFTAAERERIPQQHRPAADALVTRSEVREIDMPEFRKVSNRIEVIFDSEQPLEKAGHEVVE